MIGILKLFAAFLITSFMIYELFRLHKLISKIEYKVKHIENFKDVYNILYED